MIRNLSCAYAIHEILREWQLQRRVIVAIIASLIVIATVIIITIVLLKPRGVAEAIERLKSRERMKPNGIWQAEVQNRPGILWMLLFALHSALFFLENTFR